MCGQLHLTIAPRGPLCSARWEQRGRVWESLPLLPGHTCPWEGHMPTPSFHSLLLSFTSPGDLEPAVQILSYYLSFPRCSRLPDKGDGDLGIYLKDERRPCLSGHLGRLVTGCGRSRNQQTHLEHFLGAGHYSRH